MPEKKTNKVAADNKAETKETKKETKVEVEKKVAEVEKKVEKFEGKTDKEVEKLVGKLGFVDKIANASWIKELLNLSFVEKANVRVRKNLQKICKILGIIGLIGSIIYAIFAIIAFFAGLIGLFKGAFGAFLVGLLGLALAAFLIIIARGCMKMKKWYPAVLIIAIILDIIRMIISIFTGGFGSALLSVILGFICTLFVLKNKDMFKN